MNKFTRDALRARATLRHACRTNLLYLAREVLGYKDVSLDVHGPIFSILPQLEGGEETLVEGVYRYRPHKEIWQIKGRRERLVLYPRGHLKTTLISQAHLIQWIINYPDIRILLSCATGDQVEKVVRAIKGVFQYNDAFRDIFPDFCPPREKSNDFGSKDQFITPARTMTRGEPTLFSVTVGKTIAGYHPDVIFHSDLVDKENVKTPGGIQDVIEHFKYMNPLLERYSARAFCAKCKKVVHADPSGKMADKCPKCSSEVQIFPATRGFTYVEGTPYDFGDLHNMLLSDPAYKDWLKVIKPAQEDYPKGKILWPHRFPPEELEKIRKEIGDWLFSAQYLMKCVPQGDGLCDPKELIFIPAKVMKDLMPRLRLHVTIDLHGMENNKGNDFTVMTLGGFDRDGRLYIPEIKLGRFNPEEVIANIFDFHRRYPQIIDFKVEKDAHARVLLPFLKREMSKRQSFPTIWPIKRDTNVSKKQRIRGLRPWLKTKTVVFSDGLGLAVMQELMDEVAKFPSESAGVHDDILDTLADQMQNQEGGVTDDVVSDSPYKQESIFGMPRPRDRFLGFGEEGVSQWLYGNDGEETAPNSMTGFLN